MQIFQNVSKISWGAMTIARSFPERLSVGQISTEICRILRDFFTQYGILDLPGFLACEFLQTYSFPAQQPLEGYMKILLGCMLVVLFFTGCGDDEVDPSQPVTVRLYSEPALDGLVTSDGRIDTTAAVVSIGDDASDKILRAILSFNVSSIPSGSTIYSATLHVYQTNGSSGNSYGTNNLDAVFVDCISFDVFRPTYEPTSVVTANFATLSTNLFRFPAERKCHHLPQG